LSFENKQNRTDFVEAFNNYTKNTFESEIVQCTRTESAIAPLLLMGFLAIIGSLATYVVNAFHNYEPTRTMIVKSYVALFYKLCKYIGPVPVAIVAMLLFLLSTGWLIVNLVKPPMKTLLKKRAVL
jgi:hypothetical protein